LTKTSVIPVLVAALVLAVGCGSGTTPTGNQSPATCGGTSTSCLALVTVRGSDQLVVRDITDIANPKTEANLGPNVVPVFVSATEVSYPSNAGLVRAPFAGSPKTVVTSQAVGLFAWSPDGRTVVYTVESPAGLDVHQLTGGVDRILGSSPRGGGGGCESIAGCAIANSVDFRLAYSRDGAYVSLVINGFAPSSFRLWSSDGKLLRSNDSQGTTMSVWSGGSLYFRDAAGVQVWRDGAVSTFLAGVTWIRPSASPDGKAIVYAARDSSGWAHTYIVDIATKKVRELNMARSEPVFLTSRYIWYRGERECVEADNCGVNPPLHPASGKTYIYDLQGGTETESAITSVYDVWPHAA